MELNGRPSINPQIYEHLMFDKGAKSIQWKKESIFNKQCWHNWMSACRRMKIDSYLLPCTKLKSKWVKDLNISPTTLNLIEEKLGSRLQHLSTGDHLLHITPVAQTQEQQERNGTSWNCVASVKQRTLSLRQKGIRLNGRRSSPTTHQTKVWSPKYMKNSRN